MGASTFAARSASYKRKFLQTKIDDCVCNYSNNKQGCFHLRVLVAAGGGKANILTFHLQWQSAAATQN